jgi:Ca2+-binding EF-hand superfamily protein
MLPPGAGPRAPGPLRAAVLARFDRNHDGRLEPAERRAAIRALRNLARQMARENRRMARQQKRVRRAIRRYDLNGDGVVGPDEIAPAAARRLQPLDRNGDGWVDDADF